MSLENIPMARLNIVQIPSYQSGFSKTAKQWDKTPRWVKGKQDVRLFNISPLPQA
jgi:hypothetical protein